MTGMPRAPLARTLLARAMDGPAGSLARSFVVAVMAQAVATSWMAQRGEHDRAVALDRRMVVVSGTAYAVAIGAIMLVYVA